MISRGTELRNSARSGIPLLFELLGSVHRRDLSSDLSDLWVKGAQYGEEVYSNVMYSRLAAAFLPQIVEQVLKISPVLDNVDPLWNHVTPSLCILARIDEMGTRYMFRFMQSGRPETTRLASHVGDLMCAAIIRHGEAIPFSEPGPVRNQALNDVVGIGVFLLSLLTMSRPEIRHAALSSQAKSLLLSVFRKCSQYKEPDLEEGFTNILAVLEGRMPDTTQMLYRRIFEGKTACKWRGCNKRCEDGQWYECSRCMTVIYCSKKHQFEDWEDSVAPHKAMCYRTAW